MFPMWSHLSPVYPQKLFLLLLTSPTRFNSLRTLSFLVLFTAIWTIHLYFSQATCPCFYPLKAFFLCLTLFRNKLFIHTGFLVFLHYFLFVEMHLCLACRRWSLNIIQISWALLSSWALSHGTLSSRIFEETKACSPEVQGGELAVCSPHSPEGLAFHHFITALHVLHQPLIVVTSRFSLGCLCLGEKK